MGAALAPRCWENWRDTRRRVPLLCLVEIVSTVDLTEALEDAVSSLVIDLMTYREREEIDSASRCARACDSAA